eukprot:GFUD01026496.1.p1 GENE.GFUD01026496.1~~GFUD01026496.1.p1  ORF type:complete len:378 (+),score=106.71 GFUD01026496.1:40-1173(+)
MGASQSRGGRKQNGKLDSSKEVGHKVRSGGGYFILSFKDVKIKIVNIASSELKILTSIIKRHCKVSKEGWDRNMTYLFRLEKPEKNCLIKLVTDILLSLYKEGWEPMTPIDTASKADSKNNSAQTSICFRRREDIENKTDSCYSLASVGVKEVSNECLCIETFQSNFISFHSVPNTVLHEIITRLQQDWTLGVKGVSIGVASVISDYTINMPPTLNMVDQIQKIIQLNGSPWSKDRDIDKQIEETEQINMSIIAVLANAGFKLSMPINLENGSRVYFFIHDPEETSDQVKIPTFSMAGQAGQDTLSVYQPMMTKSKTSFYKNSPGRSNSVKNRIRASLRRKTMARTGRNNTMMELEPEPETRPWWQQKSIDMSDGET